MLTTGKQVGFLEMDHWSKIGILLQQKSVFAGALQKPVKTVVLLKYETSKSKWMNMQW